MILLFLIIILIFSVIIHEVAHGAMAYHLGDSTAKNAGRLSLNPIKHIDPIGSILVPLILIILPTRFVVGWAKPVPINPFNFKDQKYGEAKVSIAGPGANFLIALFFSLLIRFFVLPETFLIIFSIIIFLNILLGVFNLMPIPPLDGSKILFAFLPLRLKHIQRFMEQNSLILFFIFLFLVFNGFIPLFGMIYSFFGLLAGPEAVQALAIFL